MRQFFCILAMLMLFPALLFAEDLPLLKVGHVGHDHQLALYVAAEAGRSIEKTYGVYLVELKPQEVYELYERGKPIARLLMVRVGGGSKMPAELEQGHIDVGLGGLGPTAKFIDKGSPIKVIAPLNNGGDALVLRNSMRAVNWNEFMREIRGSKQPVKIGYKDPLSNAYMIFTRALQAEGIRFGAEPTGFDGKPVQVVLFDLNDLENALPSLQSGIVDGVVVNEPMPSLLVWKGIGKRVANLSDLPPSDRWKDHPCCIVAATTDAISSKRVILKALLRAIIAGGDLIERNRDLALAAEGKWTRTQAEVATASILNVEYVSRPDRSWMGGVGTWMDMMTTAKYFKKNLAEKPVDVIIDQVLDLSLINEALSEMNPDTGKVK